MLSATPAEDSKAKNDFLSTDMKFLSSTCPVDDNSLNSGLTRGTLKPKTRCDIYKLSLGPGCRQSQRKPRSENNLFFAVDCSSSERCLTKLCSVGEKSNVISCFLSNGSIAQTSSAAERGC
ncbi:hypothetical protein QYM36_020088 [Artemia franciscana]|uniref:Uncharacterized protein n=1 Tax=Artemia franciscana TaxID=6661 RepID=A0AA88KTB3_ARTSF|nr:hypothetical protein QYM36_020088 [Artemia franciscana]